MGAEVPYHFRTTFSVPVPYKTTVFLAVRTRQQLFGDPWSILFLFHNGMIELTLLLV
jgi:hypothetical protein